MRIRLGVFVGCMLFLVHHSHAEDGKSKRSMPESVTSVSKASDSHRTDATAILPAVSDVCGYQSRDEWKEAFQAAIDRGEIPDPALTSPPAVAPRAIQAGGQACAPPPQTTDIFPFEDSAGLLLTNFSDGALFGLMTSAANALLVSEGDNYDFVGFWVNFVPNHQLGAAFYLGMENNVTGIGQSLFNNRGFFGLAGNNVEGYMMMWNINDGLWAPGTAGNSASFTRLVFAQEIEHRWGMFLPSLPGGRVLQGGGGCGRGGHWNFRVDGQGSGMEIREWVGSSPAVLGGSCVSFASELCFNTDTGGVFSYADLYLMGYVSPAEMDAGNSELRYMDSSCSSPYNGTISTFSSADIVASAGTRNPSSAASQHDFHIGWIMIHQPGDPPNATELDKAVGILAQQSIDWEFSTVGVGTLNNTLQGDCTFSVKFSQRPTPDGENIASNIDWTDDDPNVVVADDFISDGRPVNSVRWWGSNLVEVAPPICGDNAVNRPSEDCDGTDDAACPGQCQADCTCPVVSACGPGAGDCCVANGTPGCDDDTCCNTVCTADSFCCDTEWDQICADAAVALCPACAPACSPAASCTVINGGFEDGNFCNWTATTNGLGEFFPWTVGAGGTNTGFHGSSPLEGLVDAINGFDGDAGLVYELYQDVALPAGATITLTTNHRIQYDSLGISSILPRELDISIRDTGNAILAPLFHQDVLVNLAPNTDLGWNTQVFDISAFAGQTIRIHFEEFIPEGLTGPAMIEFDDITLACTGPGSGSLANGGAGVGETTRVITLDTPTPRGAIAFEELRERYLSMRKNALVAANVSQEAAPSTARRITAEDLAKYGGSASWPYRQVGGARVPTDSGFGPDGFTGTVDQVVLNDPGTVATNGVNGRFLAGADFGNDGDFSFMYAVDADFNELVRLDVVTGVSTVIGPSAPAGGESWTGMAMDPTSGTMYASATVCGVSSAIYTIDLATGTATNIGDVTSAGCIIAIAIDNNGQMYGLEIVNDNLVLIDKNTGAGAVVGLIGFDASFSQGMDFDETDGTLYLAAINATIPASELYTISTATGLATLVGNLGAVAPGAVVEFDGFGIATGGGGNPIFASDPSGANLGTVDPLTGLFTVIGPFTGAAAQITEIEWAPDGSTLYASTGGGASTLHTVDPTTGTILTSVVHDVGAMQGMEFDAAGNLLSTLALGPGGANPSTLVTVDPTSGLTTVIGLTGFNAIGGLAFDAGFTTLFGITSGGAAIPPTLLDVNPATGAAVSIATVSVAVEMSSLEFRSTGQLVAGGADGIFYEIDTVTGVATAVGPLVNAGKVSGLSVKPGIAIPSVPKPDGWFISFHEPLVEEMAPQVPLGLYFCDENDIQISTTASPSCDGHTVLEYVVDLTSCCLVHANVDSRSGSIPAQVDGFFEEECFAYAIDIQAVVGHKFVDDGGTCIEVSTGKSWDEDVWGWHSTATEIGAAFGLGPALQTVLSMSGMEWLYGPWGPVDITCGQRNMSFELITDTPSEEDPDSDGDGVPDVCNINPPLPAPPPHDILKNRYISIDPRGAGQNNPSSHHIRVRLDSSQVNGQAGSGPWWAGQPDAACISVVTTTKPAVEPDWTGCDTAHLTGCPIIPTTTYALAAESGGPLSVEAFLDTQAKPGVKWHGDCVGLFTGTEWTAPNGQASIDDAVAAIKTFQNPDRLPGCATPPCNATHTSVTDMVPNLPGGPQINKIVNIADVFSIIQGFQGFEYPGPDLTQCQ